jgi:peptide-methionine (S)-S-oxide reductase
MTNASTIGQRDPAGRYETATFAAGCFWGAEATFRSVQGVVETSVGYTGGHAENPTYRQVCSGTTGHAEAVRVVYDPAVVRYEQLLDVFWSCHDPTQHNRQGPDIGEQYRSALFVHDDRQEEIARRSLRTRQEKRNGRIATQIESAGTFWPAEEYHQRYVEKTSRGAGHP